VTVIGVGETVFVVVGVVVEAPVVTVTVVVLLLFPQAVSRQARTQTTSRRLIIVPQFGRVV
jgi:hypothetical protein